MKEAHFANALLEKARQGDREALGRLLEARRATLHRLAKRQLDGPIAMRVDASDIIQQTFLEAHRSFSQFAGHDTRALTPGSRPSSITTSPARSATTPFSRSAACTATDPWMTPTGAGCP